MNMTTKTVAVSGVPKIAAKKAAIPAMVAILRFSAWSLDFLPM